MKRTITAILLILSLVLCISVNAAGADLEISELSLDKSSYKVGETASFTFEYNVPYEGITSASASFDISGIENVKMTKAHTLVCDDSTCNMHSGTDFLSFSGTKLTLGAGYSGSVTFEGKVINAEKISIKCSLKTNSGSTSKSCSAIVSDYTAPATPTPTAKPTSKPTSTPKPNSTPKPTQKPTDTTPKTPVTGASSMAICAIAAVLCGAGLMICRKH